MLGVEKAVMAEVVGIDFREKIRLDPDKLGTLYYQLGAKDAEDVICRAMEELAVRLSNLSYPESKSDPSAHHREARMIAAIADQIGMNALVRAARNLTNAISQGDAIAIEACRARLERVGDLSLLEIWDSADLSV